MKRTGAPLGTLAPIVFLITVIFVFTSVILTGAASARDSRRPVSEGSRGSSADKTPARPVTTRPDRPPRNDNKARPIVRPKPVERPAPRPKPVERPAPRPKPVVKPRPVVRPKPVDRPRPGDRPRPIDGPTGGSNKIHPIDQPAGGEYRRRPPRDIVKIDDREKKKKERGPLGRPPKNKDGHKGWPGGGGYIRPWPPRPPHFPPVIEYHYCTTYIYNYTYIYQPIILDGLVDSDIYGIGLPFGPIMPWEVGELFLIRLKNLESEGLGGQMMITIVQTIDEMSWNEFLVRFDRDITDVICYGPVGRTSFLVSMTVSDILDIMVNDEIRWVGELYPEYKIVPGGRNSKFYVRSLAEDSTRFRRELRDAGVFVMGYDPENREYYVRSSQDTYDRIARLWWVVRISSNGGEPFFQPEYEYMDVGMAP